MLASDRALSPSTSDLLSAREFIRGTIGMLDELETMTRYTTLSVPTLSLVLNRLDETHSARDIADSLRSMYADDSRVSVMDAAFRLFSLSLSVGIRRCDRIFLEWINMAWLSSAYREAVLIDSHGSAGVVWAGIGGGDRHQGASGRQ